MIIASKNCFRKTLWWFFGRGLISLTFFCSRKIKKNLFFCSPIVLKSWFPVLHFYNPVLKLFLPHIILFFLTLLDPFLRTIYLYWFLSAMGLPVTSKDLNLSSFLLTPKAWQKHQFLVNFYLVIPPKEILQKKILQKNPHKKFQKNPKKFSKNFENIQLPTSHLEAENPFGLVFSEGRFDFLFSTCFSSIVNPVLEYQENLFFKSWFIFRGRQIKVLPKRTNKAGISTSNRPPRGRGRGGFFRGGGRGYRGRGGFGAMRRPRGRGYYSPYWIPISLDIMQKYG